MVLMYRKRIIIFIAFIAFFIVSAASRAANVMPGFDLCTTPPDNNTTVTFGIIEECPPLPADFFGPGSDPFEGTIAFGGLPLETDPPNILGLTNVVVRRLQTAILPDCDSSDYIDIEIVALSLVSIDPITVTYNGGMDPEQWDVRMCLSSYSSQPTGAMTIAQECDSGGTFTATLPIVPKLIFTQLDPPHSQSILDDGTTMTYYTETGHWLFTDPGLNVLLSPGGVLVDHDCDGSVDVGVGPGSNFIINLFASPCDCDSLSQTYDVLMTHWFSECGSLGCLPTRGSLYDVSPGVDLCITPPDNSTFVDFGGAYCPPIPADFFGPGSDPFDGIIYAQGLPLNTTPSGILENTDGIIRRLEVANLPVCGSSDVIDIEIVALSLVSIDPITVTYNGGMDPEHWNVHVCLSSVTGQPTGSMLINLDCESGGTFSAEIPVIPKFIFTMVDPPYTEMILDFGYSMESILFLTQGGHWMNFDPGFNVVTSSGGITVDHDCDGAINMPVGPSSPNFYSGLYAIPCNCYDPPVDYEILMTNWYSDCAAHGCLPPVSAIHGYEYFPGDANMINGLWPPQVIGADVTFLVNYFRGTSEACLLDGFFCSADVNGDCLVIGSDVTRMVTYFRGLADILPCPDYESAWPTPDDLPTEAPAGWPNCE